MKSTRRSQPYRKGARHPGAALTAMLRGKPTFLPNPQDASRKLAKRAKRRRKSALHARLRA